MSNTYNFPSTCVDKVKDSNVKVEEKGRKFILVNTNRKEVLRIRIDNCVIKDNNSNKCDFLIIDPDKNNSYFIELKGQNVKHALKQLEDTIQKIENISNGYIKTKFSKKFAFAVLSQCPLPSTQIQNIQRRFMKTKIRLEIKNNEIRYDLD